MKSIAKSIKEVFTAPNIKDPSWHDTAYIASYSATVKYLDDLAKEINQPAIINAIRNCFDPIIPITQYFLMGTKETTDYEDFLVAALAGEVEDNIYSENNEVTISNSSYFKVLIKDSSKIVCKNLIGKKDPYTSFVCEIAGGMIAASAKQLASYNPLDCSFMLENLFKVSVEASVKMKASEIKKDIITSSDFNGVYIAAEYAYRVISNSGKFIFFKVLEYAYRVIGNSGKFIYSKAVENFYGSSEDVFPNNDLFQEDPIIDFSDYNA